MRRVKELIDAGARIPTAIKEALAAKGLTIAAFAKRYRLPEKSISNAINGNVRPTKRLLAALVKELGGAESEWATLLWEAARPAATAAA